jgi:hypothetical protein
MAAAVAAAAGPIDLRAQGTFPIRLGASVLETGSQASHWTAVRYNHKPETKQHRQSEARIQPGNDLGQLQLTLEEDDGEYVYSGSREDAEDTYILLQHESGKSVDLVLERLDGRHEFNLTSTPSETNATELMEKYPHLTANDEEHDDNGDDLFGDDDADAPADELNPFDWRHFLKAELEKPETTNANLDATRDNDARVPTPSSRAVNKPTTTAAAKRAEPKTTAAKKRKAPAVTRKAPNPKRVKAGYELPPTTSAPKSPAPSSSKKTAAPARKIPDIRVESEDEDDEDNDADADDDDDGELILEDDSVAQKPRSMGLALSGALGNGHGGPISLQSAANSPAGRMAYDTAPTTSASIEEYTFDLGGSDDEIVVEDDDDGGLLEVEYPGADEQEQEGEDEAEADADVEDLELPSPARSRPPPLPTEPSASLSAAAADEDDDFANQLAEAMMEDFEEEVPAAVESEESEEE